ADTSSTSRDGFSRRASDVFQSRSSFSRRESDQNQTQEPRGPQGARGIRRFYRVHKMVKVVRSHFDLPRGPRVPRGFISVAVYSLIIAGALSISTLRLRAQSGAVDTPVSG